MFATWGCRPCCCSCRVYKGTFPKGWERTNGDDKEQERADDEHHVASHGALVGLVRMILPGPDSCHLISENTPEWWTPPEFVQFAIFDVQIVFTKNFHNVSIPLWFPIRAPGCFTTRHGKCPAVFLVNPSPYREKICALNNIWSSFIGS